MTGLKRYLLHVCGFWLMMACVPSKQLEKGIELENTKWVLISLDGKEYKPADSSDPVHITLQSGNHSVQGFGGCNSFSGSYSHKANVLQFTLLSTKKFCHEKMDVEDYVFKTLIKVEYSIEGDVLIMKNDKGNSLAFKQDSVL